MLSGHEWQLTPRSISASTHVGFAGSGSRERPIRGATPLSHRARLRDLGERVARDGIGGVGGFDPATALLLRSRPADGARPGEPLRRPGETAPDAAVRLVLPIQGPREPGRPTPQPSRSWNSSPTAVPWASPGRRTRSLTT